MYCAGRKHHRIFYERYFPYAVKLVFRYLADYEISKEVVHDGFIKIFDNLPVFVQKTAVDDCFEFKLMAWMKTIIVRTAIDHLRREKKHAVLTEVNETVWDNETVTADDNVRYKELLVELARLPPVNRIVFNLHAIDGYSHEEIAHLLGFTSGGVRSTYFKTRKMLQKRIYLVNK